MMSYFVSAELSSFLGVSIAESIPRHQIEKMILDYAKEKELVDRQNEMVIHTDDPLEILMNGKKVFNGFSIIPSIKHHLVAIDEADTLSQGNQMEEEETSEEHSTEEEQTSEDEENHNTTYGILLRNPQGEQLIFERCDENHICIQGRFVVTQQELRELVETLCYEPAEKEQQPYELMAFLIMFFLGLVTFSLWLSVLNNSLRKM